MAIILKNKAKGTSLVELLVVIAIIVTTFVALLGVVNFSLKKISNKKMATQASFLAQEEMEALRAFRNNTDWTVNGLAVFNVAQPYHLITAGAPLAWQMVAGAEIINGFSRQVVLANVLRDVNGNIASAGALDSNTKKITVAVSWQENGVNQQIDLVGFLTNWP